MTNGPPNQEAALQELLTVIATSMTAGKTPDEIDELWHELKLEFDRNRAKTMQTKEDPAYDLTLSADHP